MKLILVRHCEKDRAAGKDDAQRPLSEDGHKSARKTGELLCRFAIRPDRIYSSQYRHSQDTADEIASSIGQGDNLKVEVLDALTPRGGIPPDTTRSETLHAIGRALKEQNGVDISESRCSDWTLVLVGHEPRLSQIVTCTTSRRERPLAPSEAICLEGSYDDLLRGQARIAYRLPIVDYQEESLRQKIETKMTVSTFLAGFSFAALIELLKPAEAPVASAHVYLHWGHEWYLPVAVAGLTLASALFVAAVFIYDRLTMPAGFWDLGDRSTSLLRRLIRSSPDYDQQGEVYIAMVRTWKNVFTGGVVSALVGFVAMVLRSENLVVLGFGVSALLAALCLYMAHRPSLGVD